MLQAEATHDGILAGYDRRQYRIIHDHQYAAGSERGGPIAIKLSGFGDGEQGKCGRASLSSPVDAGGYAEAADQLGERLVQGDAVADGGRNHLDMIPNGSTGPAEALLWLWPITQPEQAVLEDNADQFGRDLNEDAVRFRTAPSGQLPILFQCLKRSSICQRAR